MYNKKAMQELKTNIFAKYSSKLDRMILFGSRVDGNDNEFSDHDILLITKSKYDKTFEDNILDIAYDVILKYDILTDMKIINKKELKTVKGSLPFIQSAINNGITL